MNTGVRCSLHQFSRESHDDGWPVPRPGRKRERTSESQSRHVATISSRRGERVPTRLPKRNPTWRSASRRVLAPLCGRNALREGTRSSLLAPTHAHRTRLPSRPCPTRRRNDTTRHAAGGVLARFTIGAAVRSTCTHVLARA